MPDDGNISPPMDSGEACASPALSELLPLHCNVPDEQLFANVREAVRRQIPLIERVPMHNGVAVLVGGGPSVADHLDELRLRQKSGQHIFALGGAGKWLVARGIVPYAVVVLDARPFNARFVSDFPGVRFYLATQCDPSVFDAVEGQDVTAWHPNYDGKSGIVEHRKTALIGGGTSVGTRALSLVSVLGYRFIHLYGYDSSYKADAHHAFEQPENDDQYIQYARVGAHLFKSSPWMIRQADAFVTIASELAKKDHVIDVHGDGMLQMVACEMVNNPIPLPRGMEQTEFVAFYDLDLCPASYDFASFLCVAEDARKQQGLERLKVVIVPGPRDGFRNDRIPPDSAAHRRHMLWNICVPMCRLLPSVSSVVIASSRHEAARHEGASVFPDRYQVDFPAAAYGFSAQFSAMKRRDVSCFYAPPPIIGRPNRAGDQITVTLREAHYGMYRNSVLPVWIAAAQRLKAAGYRVIFVRDTEKAYEPIPEFETSPEASCNVVERVALYERSTLNLFLANGPFMLALLAPKSANLVLGWCADGEGMTADHWAKRGFPPGSQFPFVSHRNRVVWGPIDADTIVREAIAFIDERKYRGAK